MEITQENKEIDNFLREILAGEGYKTNTKKGLGKLSSDIKATKDNDTLYIEIAEATDGLAVDNINNFYQAFFQAVSRLNNKDCKRCILAMPESSRKILPIRAKILKVAWKRIAKAFPELEIWLVDVKNRKYQKTTWTSWLSSSKN